MRKLPAVEDARAVMTEGLDWSAWKWLLERKRVREIADRATAALDRAENKVKASWPDDLKLAYAELVDHSSKRTSCQQQSVSVTEPLTPELKVIAKRVKHADDKAERCRLAAEATFDEAEKGFSAELARQGAQKALDTYDLREAAIRKAEAAGQEVHSENQGVPMPGGVGPG